MPPRLLASFPLRFRLDLTLATFAVMGSVIAILLPDRAPAADAPVSYAIAISTGSDLKLADPTSSVAPSAQAGRVLACRRMVSVGSLEIGTRCKPTTVVQVGLASQD